MTSLNKEQERFKSECQEKVERQRKLENQAVNEAGFSYLLRHCISYTVYDAIRDNPNVISKTLLRISIFL